LVPSVKRGVHRSKRRSQSRDADGESGYVDVAMPKEVTDSDWVTLEGDYIATKEGYNLVVIVEAKGPGTEYYIDDFELKIP